MSTAQTFHLIGAGNGFTFCPEKVDVTKDAEGELEFADWCTLGGINKENVDDMGDAEKKDRILKSLKNAMRLYYNLEFLKGVVDSTFDDDGATSNTITEDSEDELEPKLRACQRGDIVPNTDDSPFSSAGFFTPQQGVTINYGDFIEPTQTPRPQKHDESQIYALYYGDKKDKNNFLGYAAGITYINVDSQPLYLSYGGFLELFQGDFGARVSLAGVVERNDVDIPTYALEDRDYVEIKGMHFVSVVTLLENDPEGDSSASAIDMNLQISQSVSVDSTASVLMQINDLEFFDY